MVTHYRSRFNHRKAALWRRERETPWSLRSLHEDKITIYEDVTAEEEKNLCTSDSHWNGHFCLSPGSDYGVRLKVLREHVYQFKLQRLIITLWRAQCQVPECVKAVIISKKRTMRESVPLPRCCRTELSQWWRWVMRQRDFFFVEWFKAKCPLLAHLLGLILALTFPPFLFPSIVSEYPWARLHTWPLTYSNNRVTELITYYIVNTHTKTALKEWHKKGRRNWKMFQVKTSTSVCNSKPPSINRLDMVIREMTV